jgi:hypothetical protein
MVVAFAWFSMIAGVIALGSVVMATESRRCSSSAS